MELSHKRARIELEKAANTNARNYEVSRTTVDGLLLELELEHVRCIHVGVLAWIREMLLAVLTCCALVCSAVSQDVYTRLLLNETKRCSPGASALQLLMSTQSSEQDLSSSVVKTSEEHMVCMRCATC